MQFCIFAFVVIKAVRPTINWIDCIDKWLRSHKFLYGYCNCITNHELTLNNIQITIIAIFIITSFFCLFVCCVSVFLFVGWFPVCLVCCWTFLHKILIIIYWVSLWGIHMNWWSKENQKKKNKKEQQNTRPRPRKRQNRKVILCFALSFVRFFFSFLHLKRCRCIFMFLCSSLTSSFRCPYIARVGRLRVIGEQRTQPYTSAKASNPIRK